MNILVVSDVDLAGEGSGAERVLAAHCRGLAKRGHTVYLIAGTRGHPVTAVEEIQGVRVHRYRRSLGAGSHRLFRILARQIPFAVVIFHQPLSAFWVLLAHGSRVIPKVYVFLSPWAEEYAVRVPARGSLVNGGQLFRRVIERFVLTRCQRIFVLSRFMAERLAKEHPGFEGQAALLPGGVDLDRFRPAEDRNAVKTALGIPPENLVLLTVRNLEPRMGLDHLLHAMARVAKTVQAVLLIGGRGPMENELKELAGRLGLSSSVRFEGYIPEERLPIYYQAADFFILPSKELEGFGLVAVEAMACGTPVLGTPVGAIPEVLRGLGADLVFEGIDPGAIGRGIQEQLKRVQADPEGYETLRRRCRAYAVARFGWDLIIEQLEQELLNLGKDLARSRRGAIS